MTFSIFFFSPFYMKKESNRTRGKVTNTKRIRFNASKFFYLKMPCFRKLREKYFHSLNPKQKSSLRNQWQFAHCIGVNLNHTHFNLSGYILWA